MRANVQFSIVLEKIGPLEAEQKGLMKKVQKSQLRVESLEKALDVVEKEVSEMRSRLDTLSGSISLIKSYIQIVTLIPLYLLLYSFVHICPHFYST